MFDVFENFQNNLWKFVNFLNCLKFKLVNFSGILNIRYLHNIWHFQILEMFGFFLFWKLFDFVILKSFSFLKC
jgi:hypothetical protein